MIQEKDVIDFHRSISITFLKNTSGFAVRTPRGQKDPGAIQWDPKTNSREKSNNTIKVLEATNDNLGVHLFGPLVDVDIDSDNPVLLASLDYFLPHTAHVWGRKSRPRTHRLYELAGVNTFDPGSWPFLAKLQQRPDLALEVRGGELKSARYSLLPGSVHPSGEFYEWSDPKAATSTVSHVSEMRLMQGVRFALAAALVAPHWQEGVRNELCKAFSGFMYRASSYSEELNADLLLSKDDAWDLMQGIMEIADDDPADKPMRQKTFDQTWQKAEDGAAVTGATRIAEITGDKEIVGLLYALLANTPDLLAMDRMFEQYAIIKNTVNIVDLDLGSKGNYVMNRDAFVFTMAGNYITTPKGRVPTAAVFLNSPRRTIVDRLGVNPQREKLFTNNEGLAVANTWTGWDIPPQEADVHEEEVRWFTEYLKHVVARNDEGLYNWCLMWIADIFQNPGSKPGSALVMVGEQGAGKSVLPENILRPIIGSAHSVKVSTLDKLVSKFNSIMGGKLLIQGEEVMNSNRRTDADALKDAITSSRRTVEMKGRDAFEMEDIARYIFTSNHEKKAVAIEAGDRRFTIALVSDEYAYKRGTNEEKRLPYFKRLFRHIETKNEQGEMVPNREELAKLHKFFLQVPVDRDKIRVSYETEIKRDNQHSSSKGMDAWLLSMIDWVNPFENLRPLDKGEAHSFVMRRGKLETTDGWPEFVQYSKLEASLRLFAARDYGESRSAQQIAKFFKDNGLVGSTDDRQARVSGERVRVRPFPERESIMDYLEHRGYNVLRVNDDAEPEVDNGPKF